jgi:hypothetical protein
LRRSSLVTGPATAADAQNPAAKAAAIPTAVRLANFAMTASQIDAGKRKLLAWG